MYTQIQMYKLYLYLFHILNTNHIKKHGTPIRNNNIINSVIKLFII